MKYILSLIISLGMLVSNTHASDTSGQKDFNQYCAQCHGIEGKQIKENYPRASDLTQLSLKNSGHFPYAKVRSVIDGRPTEGNIRSHGSEMPIWGNVFRAEKTRSGAQLHAEAVAKMRILNLVDYLLTIQTDRPSND